MRGSARKYDVRMAQFVLKIEKLSHIMGPRAFQDLRSPSLIMAPVRDRMIKQLLNSVIAKYHDLSVSRRSIICLSLRLRQIIDQLATDKLRYFAQSRPTIVNYDTLNSLTLF